MLSVWVKPLLDLPAELVVPSFQKLLEKSGRRIATLTAMIPAMVSRTPHRLMVRAEGLALSVMTIRMRAAVTTKIPRRQ